MKYFYKYNEKGSFDGFLIDKFNEIPEKEVIELSEGVYNECLNYKCSLKGLNKIPTSIERIEDIEIYFNKESLEFLSDSIDEIAILNSQLSKSKIEVMQNKMKINNLTSQIVQGKLDSMNKDKIISLLMKESANNKLSIMQLKK